MINIILLKDFSAEIYNSLGHNGYLSDQIYKAEKYSDEGIISFVLKPEKQKNPYTKTWIMTDENIAHYSRIVSEGYSFGAYVNNEPAGIILCEERKWNNTLYIENLFVSEYQRRKGIGKLLIEKVIDSACRDNFRLIELETQNTNAPAILFYGKQGFEITGLNLKLYDPAYNKDETAVFMTYDLKVS
ncbi:MAG: GNAT family N-acetyltransferase [Bacteroidetes bacterium]|nr:GNAT family N-acetyltransferase [Bacteroidota bacterium]